MNTDISAKETNTLLTNPVRPDNSDLTRLQQSALDFTLNIENASPNDCSRVLDIAQNLIDAVKAKMAEEEIIETEAEAVEESTTEEESGDVEEVPKASVLQKYLGKV